MDENPYKAPKTEGGATPPDPTSTRRRVVLAVALGGIGGLLLTLVLSAISRFDAGPWLVLAGLISGGLAGATNWQTNDTPDDEDEDVA